MFNRFIGNTNRIIQRTGDYFANASSIIRSLSTRSAMPPSVEIEHKNILSSITKKHADNLIKIYKIVKNPDASMKHINQLIELAKLPDKTKGLLREISNRERFPIDSLRGLPEKEEIINNLTPDNDSAECEQKSDKDINELFKEKLESQGYIAFINKEITVNKYKHNDLKAGMRAPSQISLVALKDNVMIIYLDRYNVAGNPERYDREALCIYDNENKYILLQMMCGYISVTEARRYLNRILKKNTDYSAEQLCDGFPGNADPNTPTRVISFEIQYDLEKQPSLLAGANRFKRHTGNVCKFDLVQSIINEKEVEIYLCNHRPHHDFFVNHYDFQVNEDVITAIFKVAGEMFSDGSRHFSLDKVKSKGSIVFRLSITTPGYEWVLSKCVTLLQLEMSQGWERRKGAFIKAKPADSYKWRCYAIFFDLANLDNASVSGYLSSKSHFSIASKGDFLLFQAKVLGRNISELEPGMVVDHVDYIPTVAEIKKQEKISKALLFGATAFMSGLFLYNQKCRHLEPSVVTRLEPEVDVEACSGVSTVRPHDKR